MLSFVITDYDEPLQADTKSKSLDFAKTVLVKIVREARRDKSKNRAWQFNCPTPDGSANEKSIIVCTFISEKFTTSTPIWNSNKLIISLQQAKLLSFSAIKRVNELNTPDKLVLISLAGSVIAKNDLPAMAEATGMEIKTLVSALNASSLIGGEYLAESELALALLFIKHVVRYNRNKVQKQAMIEEKVESYLKHNKQFNKALYDAVAPYIETEPYVAPMTYEELHRVTMEVKAKNRGDLELYAELKRQNELASQVRLERKAKRERRVKQEMAYLLEKFNLLGTGPGTGNNGIN